MVSSVTKSLIDIFNNLLLGMEGMGMMEMEGVGIEGIW